MRILVVGLRGVPGIPGGVETHVQHLYPKLTALGFDVTIACRSEYWDDAIGPEWNHLKRVRIWAPKTRSLEAAVHTLLSVVYAAVRRPDVLHVHAIGPGLWVPLARLLGLRVVFTHHGPDYDREKWGLLAKWVLRFGERVAVRYAHTVVCISDTIRRSIENMRRGNAVLIPNGVPPPERISSQSELRRLDLTARKYVLLVSRFVPEKRHQDLVRAFLEADLAGWKLALVGGVDDADPYVSRVKATVSGDPRIVFAGQKAGSDLAEIFTNAGVFVLPSSHEGLPIALLEALSYGVPVLVSDIDPHKEMRLPPLCYFPLGDTGALKQKLQEIAAEKEHWDETESRSTWVLKRYSWESVAQKTADVYRQVS